MAKKNTKNVEEEAEGELEDEEDNEDEEEIELLQVDTGDMIKVKQIMDETVAAAVLEHIDEDYKLDNIKLIIMTAACAFAMVAQFAPIPFPDSRIILGACCCCYFVLSGVLQLITTFVDMDSILITRPLSKNGPNGCGPEEKKTKTSQIKNKDLFQYGVRVRSQFPRFSEWYTVILELQNKEKSPCVSQKWSVGQFFDKEGMFDEIGLQMEVDKLYHRLENGDYDKDVDAKKKD
ncbi:microsomal signal peptidase subunit SPC25 [Nitzschia inconspicua]|uniref:Signal peptidase complex subunit 2 n=1 Tax=Nitzschia inconspicua TaxID=303405 RepID=A0A9K3KB12_9STRA|nr:microsomal signal peptidase subunit SPC25 [Nitzschia inconspicua]